MPTNESRRPTVLTRRKRRKEERQRPSLNESVHYMKVPIQKQSHKEWGKKV